MNIDGLLDKYFTGSSLPNIEVFDNKNIFNVYTDVVNMLKRYPDIELSVLQALSYCFYEVLDNVLTHSGKTNGTVITKYSADKSTIQILVADDGMGIRSSLAENSVYQNISEKDAIIKCIEDKVTDGKGMGFGLYSTLCLVKNAGIRFEIHSGSHILIFDGKNKDVLIANHWQGTVVYIELHADKEINPNKVLEDRADAENDFNERFLDIEDIENLW
ncbi:MAG: sensor histidine kinase [Bacteroidales bacterium]|nr:sensor histidine kinase [Bacteroidales bacterium]MBP3254836.1 sensor histidine kinase [Bacteroidales bacterium]